MFSALDLLLSIHYFQRGIACDLSGGYVLYQREKLDNWDGMTENIYLTLPSHGLTILLRVREDNRAPGAHPIVTATPTTPPRYFHFSMS